MYLLNIRITNFVLKLINNCMRYFNALLIGVLFILNSAYSQPVIDKANMDLSYKPGDDFFLFANGGWTKTHSIPADMSRYGAFDELRENNSKQLKDLIDGVSAEKNYIKGGNKQKISDFFNSGMDEQKIEALGYSPILPELEKIRAVQTKQDLIKLLTYLNSIGYSAFYRFGSTPDSKDVNNVIGGLNQGGLSLPDRDYYLKDDSRSKSLRDAYRKYVVNMMKLIGYADADAEGIADRIIGFETKMAEISFSRYELQDPQKNYNKMTLAELKTLCPQYDWSLYFTELGIADPGYIDVSQKPFFEGFGKVFDEASIEDLKVVLEWNVLRRSADYLSSAFVNESFDFSKFTSGAKEIRPRWKRVLDVISFSLGEALGELYVEKYFPPTAKARVLDMVNNIKAALKIRIENLSWMSPKTKEAALNKLSKMFVKIGYPDKWRDYSKIEITKDSYIENLRSVRMFNFKDDLSKIGKPYDKTRWGMSPQTVNASYNPLKNEITFPAGILQPPFFFANADDAVNYGGIGVVIGHEITHGFDDNGKQFDADGNMTNWWTPEDSVYYSNKTEVLVEQFDKIYVLDTLHVDGKLTIGENIADLGGVTISLSALDMSWKKNPPAAEIEGFNPLQRFFLSYAQIWRDLIRDKELAKRLKEDVHSPAVARVNGTVYNVPEFYKAFDISPMDKLFKKVEDRAVIW